MALVIRLSAAALLLGGCSGATDISANQTSKVAASAPAINAASVEARVGGRTLKLVSRQGGCALDIDGAVTPTGISAPCSFLRPKPGAAAWTHDYGAWGTIILAGGPPTTVTQEAAAQTGRKTADSCSDEGVAILVSGGKVALATLNRAQLWFCPDAAPDEKYYHGIAHRSKFAERKVVG
jgi:hypothetical protein